MLLRSKLLRSYLVQLHSTPVFSCILLRKMATMSSKACSDYAHFQQESRSLQVLFYVVFYTTEQFSAFYRLNRNMLKKMFS